MNLAKLYKKSPPAFHALPRYLLLILMIMTLNQNKTKQTNVPCSSVTYFNSQALLPSHQSHLLIFLLFCTPSWMTSASGLWFYHSPWFCPATNLSEFYKRGIESMEKHCSDSFSLIFSNFLIWFCPYELPCGSELPWCPSHPSLFTFLSRPTPWPVSSHLLI